MQLWETFYPARYHITPDLFHSHTFESPVFDWGASQVLVEEGRVVAFATVKKSATPSLYAGGDPDRYHLQSIAFERPTHGGELLDAVLRTIRQRGGTELVFGQDSLHFFPGVPQQCGMLKGFLELARFETKGQTFDLENDLSAYDPPERVDASGFEFRRAKDQDMGAILEFFASEFPLRWCYDIRAKMEVEGADTIFGMFEGDRCHGFSLLQDWSGCELPIGGAVWHLDLGEKWGSLGPIGISKEVRGRGLGDALLRESLLDLKARGAQKTIIDWTNLFDFYGAHGFTVARTYDQLFLDLQ